MRSGKRRNGKRGRDIAERLRRRDKTAGSRYRDAGGTSGGAVVGEELYKEVGNWYRCGLEGGRWEGK